jgi:C-terminal processing protease CtpA/Prc
MDPKNKISDEQKIYELSKIWKDAEYNFAFWDKVDIDWDEAYKNVLPRVLATSDIYEYYKELSRFLALLNDGHSSVALPMDIMQSAEYYSMLPIYTARIGNDIVVFGVAEEYKEQIPLLSKIKAINGVEINEYIREKCYPYIWHGNEDACGNAATIELIYGRAGSEEELLFEKDGNSYSVKLKRVDANGIKWHVYNAAAKQDTESRIILDDESCKIELTGDGIAVIKITTFMDDSVPQKIYDKFEELKNAKGYLIDVRGNGGGNSGNGDAIAAMFIDGKFESCAAETQVYEPTYKAWGMFRDDFKEVSPDKIDEQGWDEDSIKSYKMFRHIYFKKETGSVENNAPGRLSGPVAVLMNEYTVSAAEDFVDVMKQYTDAVFVGNNTAGTSGQPYCVSLESGGFYRICTRRCIAQNGEDIYNKGFSPDVKVLQTLDDLTNGYDRAREKAIEILGQRGNKLG